MPEATSDWEVLTRLVGIAGRDVVDVGCGQGQLVQALDRHGARAVGIEVTEAKVRNARHAGDGSGARFAVGRGEALALPDASRDVVVYLRSLHHVPVEAMATALAEARRVLRPGGVLYVVEPLPEGDFYALVSLVEDETAVRAAAQQALRRAGAVGLRRIGGERYETAGMFAGLDDVRERIIGVDPARAPVFDARREELQRRFDAGGTWIEGVAKEFRSAQQAVVLRAS